MEVGDGRWEKRDLNIAHELEVKSLCLELYKIVDRIWECIN